MGVEDKLGDIDWDEKDSSSLGLSILALVAAPKSMTPPTTVMSDTNLLIEKHISSPPKRPQYTQSVRTKTNTACKPFNTPALVAPPGSL